MPNEVKNIRYDVAGRIGDKFNPGQILRAMQRVYSRLNRQFLCIEKTLTIPADTFSDETKSYAIPGDLIKEFNVLPTDTTSYGAVVYVPKELWDANQYLNCHVYTKQGGLFIFGNVSAESAFSIKYYSCGLTLVDAEDADIGDDTNTPEWEEDFWPLLMYETCLELSADYPLMKNDMAHAEEMRTGLARANKNQQDGVPISGVPYGLASPGVGSVNNDPDYVDGLWVTRS